MATGPLGLSHPREGRSILWRGAECAGSRLAGCWRHCPFPAAADGAEGTRLNASPLALCDRRPFSLLGFGDILVPGTGAGLGWPGGAGPEGQVSEQRWSLPDGQTGREVHSMEAWSQLYRPALLSSCSIPKVPLPQVAPRAGGRRAGVCTGLEASVSCQESRAAPGQRLS